MAPARNASGVTPIVESLCNRWTACQVLAHLILAARPPASRYMPAVLKARGNFDRANHRLAVVDPEATAVAQRMSDTSPGPCSFGVATW